MGFPKDLRQKMINLMYLVLMAMLALFADPAALKAFKQINRGLDLSGQAFDQKNESTLRAIKEKAEDTQGEAALDYFGRSTNVRTASNELQTYIDGLLKEVRVMSTKVKKGVEEFDDVSKVAAEFLMMGATYDGKAFELREKIQEALTMFQQSLEGARGMTDEEITEVISSFPLNIDNPPKDKDNPEGYNWELFTFKGKPAIALVTLLKQIKNDVKTTEGQILDEFRTRLDIDKIKFDQFNAAVIPSSTYLQRGDEFSAEIFLAASTARGSEVYDVYVNGQRIPVDARGVATYTSSPGVGEYTLDGRIVVHKQDGTSESHPFDPVKYQVAAPSGTVAADKMNVLYIGVDNPLTVSAAGVPLDQVSASCVECNLTANGPGKYTAKPEKQGKATVTVTANEKTMGTQEFRVKRIPDPTPMVGTRKSGTSISTGELSAQTYVRAVLENFDFDAKFDVLGYDMMLAAPGKTAWRDRSQGARFTSNMKSALSKVRPGWYVIISNIKAKGPDGTTRDIGSITYSVR